MKPCRPVLVVAAALLAVLPVAGCSVSAGTPDRLSGNDVARQANAQLEKQNPRIRHGSLRCDDVAFEVGAEARCLRTVRADGGREVRIGATVTIDRVSDGGHYKVEVDDQPQQFGLTGDFIARDIAQQYEDKFGQAPEAMTCPYLKGEVGTTITCKLRTAGRTHDVEVRATAVDPATYDTDYTFAAPTLTR